MANKTQTFVVIKIPCRRGKKEMFKRLLYLSIPICVLIILPGCGSSNEPQSETSPRKRFNYSNVGDGRTGDDIRRSVREQQERMRNRNAADDAAHDGWNACNQVNC